MKNETIKNTLLKEYKHYQKEINAYKLKLGLDEIANYLTSDIDNDFNIKDTTLDEVLQVSKKKASISNTIIDLTTYALTACIKKTEILNNYDNLSNTQKRKAILKALTLSIKIDYIFDRSASEYNVVGHYYISKTYVKGYKLSLSNFLYTLAVILNDKTITR